MKRYLYSIALLLLFTTTKAQCPDGAGAGIVFYIHQIGISPGGPPIIDTSNTFYVSNFQPGTTVYLYTNYNTLIDSVFTSGNGSGSVILSPSVNDSLWPSGSGFTSAGFATNGICTLQVGGVGLLPVNISRFSVTKNNNTIFISWQTEMDEPGIKYIIQQSDNGTDFRDLTTILSTSTNTGRYAYSGNVVFNRARYFRIKIIGKDQRIYYSDIKTISSNILADVIVSAISGNRFLLNVPESFVQGSYAIFNEAGVLLERNRIFYPSVILSPKSSKGVYFVRVSDRNGKRITKSFIISE